MSDRPVALLIVGVRDNRVKSLLLNLQDQVGVM
jgi:hypothetical protein